MFLTCLSCSGNDFMQWNAWCTNCEPMPVDEICERLCPVDVSSCFYNLCFKKKLNFWNTTRWCQQEWCFESELSEIAPEEFATLALKPHEKVITLHSGGTCEVKVTFSGSERIKNFNCAIIYKAYGMKGVIFYTRASVIDYEFSLDQRSLVFSPTTIGCHSLLKFALINSGDIGARFTFDTELLSEVFVIKPRSGYSSPGSTIVVEVTFIPTSVMQYYNNMLICSIDNYRSLTLNVSGVGARLPLPTSTLRFISQVRQIDRRSVQVQNKSATEQIVVPVISGEYFSGEKSIKIPSNDSTFFEVVYNPLTLTRHQFHEGSLFFSYPNGEECLYKLLGTALEPSYSKEMQWTCVAGKMKYGKVLVENSSSTPRTFIVNITAETSVPLFYLLEADDTISIPPKEKRHFKIGVLFYKECSAEFKVEFEDEHTAEYQKYKISITVSPRLMGEAVRLRAIVRKGVIYKIPLWNPMNKTATFRVRTLHPDLTPRRRKIIVKPLRKRFLKLKYLPYDVEKIDSAIVQVSNYLLGEIVHTLILDGIAPPKEKTISVQANIGSDEPFFINVKNPSTKLASCFIQEENSDFSIKKPIFWIPGGKTYKVEVIFSPSRLGAILSNIKVISDKIGSFEFSIMGTGHPPKPQGTFVIPRSGNLKIKFKNFLNEQASFSCEINNQEFKVKSSSFFLAPRQFQIIEIQHVPYVQWFKTDVAHESCCKLVIWNTNTKPTLHWIYYFTVGPKATK